MKHITISILMIVGLWLTACSASATLTPTASTNNDLPTETQLAVGTLKLEGTDQAVSVEQAKELVVYWQVYQTLSQSETTAQAEIDGLVAQIQEAMTDDQMKAITDMAITQQDVLTSMQGVTISSSDSGNRAVSSSSSGGMPAGGPPADGGGAPPDGGMPAEMGGAAPDSGTSQPQSAQTGLAAAPGVPSALVEAVIQSLEEKISA